MNGDEAGGPPTLARGLAGAFHRNAREIDLSTRATRFKSVVMKRPPPTPQRMNKNTLATLAAFALIGVGLTGCGKKADSSGNPAPPKGQPATTAATTPVMQSVLTIWQQGDKSAAVAAFLETDWSARPLFAPGSTLSLSETQFQARMKPVWMRFWIPGYAKRAEAQRIQMTKELSEVKQLAAAVAQAGRDAAAKQDLAQAAKHFTSLKQCGAALNRPDSLAIVKLVGQAMTKMADGELAKLKQ